jgi:hypothetical protein
MPTDRAAFAEARALDPVLITREVAGAESTMKLLRSLPQL